MSPSPPRWPRINMAEARQRSAMDEARRRADPRVQAAMRRLLEARGITLDGDTPEVRDRVAFYQACVLLAEIDRADPLRADRGPLPWLRRQEGQDDA